MLCIYAIYIYSHVFHYSVGEKKNMVKVFLALLSFPQPEPQ